MNIFCSFQQGIAIPSWKRKNSSIPCCFTHRSHVEVEGCSRHIIIVFIVEHTDLWCPQVSFLHRAPQKTQFVDPMLFWCWSSVSDAGPTSKQHRVSVKCLPAHCWRDGHYRNWKMYWWASYMDPATIIFVRTPPRFKRRYHGTTSDQINPLASEGHQNPRFYWYLDYAF